MRVAFQEAYLTEYVLVAVEVVDVFFGLPVSNITVHRFILALERSSAPDLIFSSMHVVQDFLRNGKKEPEDSKR